VTCVSRLSVSLSVVSGFGEEAAGLLFFQGDTSAGGPLCSNQPVWTIRAIVFIGVWIVRNRHGEGRALNLAVWVKIRDHFGNRFL